VSGYKNGTLEKLSQRHPEAPGRPLYWLRHPETPMFDSKELELLSYSLMSMKELQEADLFITENEEFLSLVRTQIKETDALMAKVKALM
jgi:hypothetical protein